MNRRNMLKAIGIAALASTSAEGAVRRTAPKVKRSVFKIVQDVKPPLAYVSSPEWEPTVEDVERLRGLVQRTDSTESVVTPYREDQKSPSFIMVKCGFEDLRKGDLFVMYEETGELVVSTHLPRTGRPCVAVETEYSISVCLENPKKIDGVWRVRCEPIVDALYFVPSECPA